MKIIFYTFLVFFIASIAIASEYNLDAIVKAKGENSKQLDIDKEIAEDADKDAESVSKEYYYKYTLPAIRAAEARRKRNERARQNAGVTTKDCFSIQFKCEEKCKHMRNQFMILGSSDRARCKSRCSSAFSLCNIGLIQETKVELCKSNCEMFIDNNGGFLKKSDREKCYDSCTR